MTNENELVRELADDEQGTPCFVRHEDAGGLCERLAVMKVYGLGFCEVHGSEARITALSEATHDAEMFFERFRNPHVPHQSAVIERGLTLVQDDLSTNRSEIGGKDHDQALLRAYPDGPEKLRTQIHQWELDTRANEMPVLDELLDMLTTVSKLMRIAFEEGETWLVELLEEERESVAAQAAVALENSLQRRAELTRVQS